MQFESAFPATVGLVLVVLLPVGLPVSPLDIPESDIGEGFTVHVYTDDNVTTGPEVYALKQHGYTVVNHGPVHTPDLNASALQDWAKKRFAPVEEGEAYLLVAEIQNSESVGGITERGVSISVTQSYDSSAEYRAWVALHEVGHARGATHDMANQTSIMAPSFGVGRSGYTQATKAAL